MCHDVCCCCCFYLRVFVLLFLNYGVADPDVFACVFVVGVHYVVLYCVCVCVFDVPIWFVITVLFCAVCVVCS